MKTVPLRSTSGLVVPNCHVARTFLPRFLGLMGRKGLPSDHAVAFPNCNSIHTMFMRFRIDVIFLNREGLVLDVVEKMKPWRMLLPRKGTKHIVEMQGGVCRAVGIVPGMKLVCEGVTD